MSCEIPVQSIWSNFSYNKQRKVFNIWKKPLFNLRIDSKSPLNVNSLLEFRFNWFISRVDPDFVGPEVYIM